MKTSTLTRLLFITTVLALAACGSGGKVGDACATAGAMADECGDGAVCTQEGTALVCAKLCAQQSDCASTEACNGVSGSDLKSCQPK
jgi:hypothetical protein